MLRIYTDFNTRTVDDLCWLLKYRRADLADLIAALGLSKGDNIILYQDEDDFEVTAMLDYRYVDALAREAWVAVPDWDTLVRL